MQTSHVPHGPSPGHYWLLFVAAAERALQAEEAAVERVLSASSSFVDRVADRVVAAADALIAQAQAVARYLASIPGVILARVERIIAWLVQVFVLVFVTIPRWLVYELPRRIAAQAAAMARAVVGFFRNEVVPTSEFFVEVPLGLGGAAARDLLYRGPLWTITEGPAALLGAFQALGRETIVLVLALFDRFNGIARILVDRVLFVLDVLHGGMRWLRATIVFTFGPWLLRVVGNLSEEALLAAQALLVFLFIDLRLGIWRFILRVPGYVQAALNAVLQALDAVLDAVWGALVRMLDWLTAVPPYIWRVLVSVYTAVAKRVVAVVRWLARIPANVWGALVRLYHAFATGVMAVLHWVARLPANVWRALVSVYSALVNGLLATVRWLVALPPKIGHFVWETVRAIGRLAWAAWSGLADVVYAVVTAFFEFAGRVVQVLWDAAVSLAQFIFHDIPLFVWSVFVRLVRFVFHDLPLFAWNVFVQLLRFVFHDVPLFVWSALVWLTVDLPKAIARAVVETVRAVGEELVSVLKVVMRPVGNVLTWALAIAILPAYLVARILRGGGEGPIA